uniref:Relaxin-3-like n=1 Tax=Hippocampus comes TaxID=109280 RepID=A0A3Q2XEJ8_HIPCM
MFLRVAVCVLLSALVVHGDVQPHTISRALLPRVYGVKLCGREFIRAVIFTCGGSRWKRFIDADYGERTDQHDSSNVFDALAQERWRRRRRFSQGVAGVCCNEGCTKNDIGGLC